MSLKEYLIQEIKSKGLLSIEQFMNIVLTGKSESYYISSFPLGKTGDFVTAPEISQLFGEIIAIWLMLAWEKLGKPPQLNLIELGPGRGTLMRDILKSTRKFTDFQASINKICLVECNNNLIQSQASLLKDFDQEVEWFNSFYQIPTTIPFLLVANEFFDALPIKQYIKKSSGWYEIMIGMDIEYSNEISFTERPLIETETNFLNLDYSQLKEGDIVETSYESLKLMQHVSNQLLIVRGAALIIDYGYNRKKIAKTHFISSLQAVKAHNYHPVLEDLGKTDLSAMVDFGQLIEVLENYKCENYTYSTQREFLLNYGVSLRFRKLLHSIDNSSEQENLFLAYDRLVNAEKMGNLYKVLEFYKI